MSIFSVENRVESKKSSSIKTGLHQGLLWFKWRQLLCGPFPLKGFVVCVNICKIFSFFFSLKIVLLCAVRVAEGLNLYKKNWKNPAELVTPETL